MPDRETIKLLEDHGIRPTAQRVVVADFVLNTDAHPSADEVHSAVRERLPVLSRATVYNTLGLLVERGLLRELVLAEGRTVYDPNLRPHHHFVDETTCRIFDIPSDALSVTGIEGLEGLEVREHSVVLRGRVRD